MGVGGRPVPSGLHDSLALYQRCRKVDGQWQPIKHAAATPTKLVRRGQRRTCGDLFAALNAVEGVPESHLHSGGVSRCKARNEAVLPQ